MAAAVMKAWLVLGLGLLVAAVAGVALLRGGDPPAPAAEPSARARTEKTAGAPTEPQHAEIDDASRARLEEILQSAGDEEAP